ncbi:hypothetical protein V0288_24820 [Pannus brasiliensis CCIBt3594]|uniref:Transposase n=1 Tax=Pannus brasiliensis CCIBt3594 TaxID=1427578 RepID=A0AAW9QYF8_9CHRO
MSPRKLTDATKKEILKLYRETEATTSTLAERYGVSSSTISRFLKNSLSEVEYEDLIQKKRLARTPRGGAAEEEAIETPEPVLETPEPVLDKTVAPPLEIVSVSQQLTLPVDIAPSPPEEEEEEDEEPIDVDTLNSILDEDIDDEEDEEDEDEDWGDDEDEEDEGDDGEQGNYSPRSISRATRLQVLPLSSASFPKTCYLVIDRSAELITRPLKDFAELGQVPPQEIQQRTLPVFDSHRVARRFSKRRERVIKVPDGRVIEKVGSHLEAKGITRLLMDGNIYSLSPL